MALVSEPVPQYRVDALPTGMAGVKELRCPVARAKKRPAAVADGPKG
jgi:hypothetical protein